MATNILLKASSRREEFKQGLQVLFRLYRTSTEVQDGGLKTFEELFNNDKQPKVNNEEMKKLYTRVTGQEIPNTAQFCFMPFKEQSSIIYEGYDSSAGEFGGESPLSMSTRDEVAKKINIYIRGTKFLRDITISTGNPTLGLVGWMLGFKDGDPISMDAFLRDFIHPGHGVSEFPGKLKLSFAESLKAVETFVDPITKDVRSLPSIMTQLLEDYETYNEGDDVVIYGHSMGGGIAQILAYILAAGPKKFKSITVILAGSVRVLDKKAVQFMKERGVEVFNFVAQGDPVPNWWDFEFVEPGELISFIPNQVDFSNALKRHELLSYLAVMYSKDTMKALFLPSQNPGGIEKTEVQSTNKEDLTK
ncbi:hypothetical protein BFJ66_g13985 [Fusarium oxysporum f. sp. cepae]|uniref:Fungal lipase-type domain-containing protein n=1 Tax=Fusarium oxysporum f. sp. cepae TaxID=396571 RepID=A0A3L6NZS9_FUSOX|nr:hypothetical protein BFJ65_g3006 [Fusarium oxysporum f. sp. cepae]RKK33925.1 hypothetical protein BFJ67_g14037 [Fusarium oxysporum f. sp. cepae]RKK35407.1 hypothetical protein BFJ66_g13985 [Fusarium oxysporum f. sp. cepae]